ncbi:tetratricopeptide repeat protein [Lichenicoccus sp.]|uniref:tetratricopeptide repeat protein n=1 Tax=Lichenicoccus sp. TaxID=2781899 RepID=UPI003D0B0AB3
MHLACIGRVAASGLFALLLAGSLSGGSAHAQLDSREAISLQDQILELRHEMRQMQSGGGEGSAPPMAPSSTSVDQGAGSPLTSQLLDRVSTLEAQVRDLRGQLDQLNNQVQQQNAALSKQIGDMSFAVQQAHPEGGVPGGNAGDAGPPPPPARPERRTPELALQQGNAALAHRDYAGAQAAAREVLAGPKGPRQTDAQFLLAQSLAGQRQYQQAATAYYDVYTHAPHSGRAPDALLGVSASLLALGDKTDACQALQKLRAEFPSPQPRVSRASLALRGRGGCR